MQAIFTTPTRGSVRIVATGTTPERLRNTLSQMARRAGAHDTVKEDSEGGVSYALSEAAVAPFVRSAALLLRAQGAQVAF